jgi:hypothetical protein
MDERVFYQYFIPTGLTNDPDGRLCLSGSGWSVDALCCPIHVWKKALVSSALSRFRAKRGNVGECVPIRL